MHLWYAAAQALTQAVRQDCQRLLDRAELARWARFRFEQDRDDYLVAHALVRRVLSAYTPVPPEDWRFRAGPFGKPEAEAAGLPSIRFNLSHTRGLAAVAVTAGREIGVDAEWWQPPIEPYLARRVLAETEYRQLQQATGADSQQMFFDFWTLKEAYLKACGVGLSRSLQGFALVLSRGQPPRIQFAKHLPDSPERWQFWQDRTHAGYSVAVAVCRASDETTLPLSLHIRHLNLSVRDQESGVRGQNPDS